MKTGFVQCTAGSSHAGNAQLAGVMLARAVQDTKLVFLSLVECWVDPKGQSSTALTIPNCL